MSERTRIGSLFGQAGMYVSRAGDSVSSPSGPLLLDSRYDCLEIHQTGRVSLPSYDTTDGFVSYQATVGFPSLGYVPQVTFGVVVNDDQTISYPPGRIVLSSGTIYYANDHWLNVTSNSLTYNLVVIGDEHSLSLFYVVYRNPRTKQTYTPTGTERVFIGNHSGTFKMRVSKPGFTARNANRDQCVIHEDKRPLIPVATGTFSFGAGATQQFYLGQTFAFPPKIVTTSGANGPVPVMLQLNTGLIRFGWGPIGNMALSGRFAIYHPA